MMRHVNNIKPDLYLLLVQLVKHDV